jgi:hypothetical protein
MGRHTLSTRIARRMNAARRTTTNAGRPRIPGPRCPCEVMTLARAQARGKSSEHDPNCSFYRDRTIIV